MSYINPSIGRVNIPDGSGKGMGLATLVSGGATVIHSLITNNTRIMVTPQTGVLNSGFVWVDNRTAGVSFHIASSNPSDGREVAWFLFEPV